ncbi:MAG: tRNA preQ1(34) S-adenosylmethionine ribosyltransferase-isomerase QueA [Chloroflexi bacterium]|nr:tRNA preQ1(34) S-adenosylmethionine ribosyltransferase-isomerase QueA [Chloroflexota bacterium]
MKTSDFDYELPSELIAQTPIEPRDASRLLVLDRQAGSIAHHKFHDIGDYLKSGDLLVVNQTRVLRARLYARKVPTGGRVEILLLNQKDDLTWQVLVGGKGVTSGKRLELENGLQMEVIAQLAGSHRMVRFEQPIEGFLEQIGHVPLPPYINTPLADSERYQTVYARDSGSAAAPTAGLHFTAQLIEKLKDRGVGLSTVTLHVGLDTFAPVTEADPQDHKIHTEWCRLSAETAQTINKTRKNGGRIVAVGTTSVRVLETGAQSAASGNAVGAFENPSDLFILPGHTFRAVDTLITNFHLPRSSLLMLVSAFAGRERILDAYQTAIQEGYRFYSFGDAMLII